MAEALEADAFEADALEAAVGGVAFEAEQIDLGGAELFMITELGSGIAHATSSCGFTHAVKERARLRPSPTSHKERS